MCPIIGLKIIEIIIIDSRNMKEMINTNYRPNEFTETWLWG